MIVSDVRVRVDGLGGVGVTSYHDSQLLIFCSYIRDQHGSEEHCDCCTIRVPRHTHLKTERQKCSMNEHNVIVSQRMEENRGINA